MEKIWAKEDDLSKGVKILLLILYPFGAFLYSLKNAGSKTSYIVFFSIYILFGITFVAQNEAADSFRYVEEFQTFSIAPNENLQAIIQDYFQPGSNIKDLYEYIVYYITAIIAGNNYHFMFLLVGLVFGFFALASLRYITNNPLFENTLPFFILLFIFTFSNSIFNINGFRFWTASWVAVYISFKILIDKKSIYLLLLPILPLIHLSFNLYIMIFLFSLIIRRYPKLVSILFIISFFYSDILLNNINGFKELLPQNIQNQIWSYTESSNALDKISGKKEENMPIYALILNSLPRYYIMLMATILIKEMDKLRDNTLSYSIGCMYLSMQTLFNFCMAIPSIHRFNQTLIPFIIFLWVNSYDILGRYKKLLLFAPLVYSYHIWYWIRYMISISDPYFYISNAPHLIIKNLL